MIYDGKRVGKCILVRFILSLVILCLIPMWGKYGAQNETYIED